ncbi:hypothetical protein I317_04740 [Kwoniella heveanensis CBS 569]|nr:hypothetical protein I317_04740 [Kwoniella heveanensis CBS 569]
MSKPTVHTHTRKIELLSHSRIIIIRSLPSMVTSEHLLDLFPAISNMNSKSDSAPDPDPNPNLAPAKSDCTPLFPKLDHLELDPTFISELADWLNRNWITPRTDIIKIPRHPFLDFLLLAFTSSSSVTQNLTLIYPTYNEAMLRVFFSSRYGDERTLQRCGITHDRRRHKIKAEWNLFMDEGVTLALMPLVFNFPQGLERVVVTGVVRSSIVPLRCSKIKVEFRECACVRRERVSVTDNQLQPQANDRSATCVDHVDIDRRVEQISELLTPSYAASTSSTGISGHQQEHDHQSGLVRPDVYEFVDAELGGDDEVEEQLRGLISLSADEVLKSMLLEGRMVFTRSDTRNRS